MAVSSLSRTQKVMFTGMLTAATEPNWSEPAYLLRFTEQQGTNTMFVVNKDAIKSFKALEVDRIYTFEVPGRCVKSNQKGVKFGVNGPFDVKMQYPVEIKVAQVAWPLKLQYNPTPFGHLNQLEDGTFIDIYGEVIAVSKIDMNEKLPKCVWTLQNGDFSQEIHALGRAARKEVKNGDKIAGKGLIIRSWRGARTLETSHLTIIEVNPRENDALVFEEETTDGPKTKAIKVTSLSPITVASCKQLGANLLQDETATKPEATCALVARINPLTDKFFKDDSPTFGEEGKLKSCLNCFVHDSTGTLDNVKLWDRAAYEIMRLNGDELHELWKEGVENEDKQEEIINKINVFFKEEVLFSCSVAVYTYTIGQEVRKKLQYNINNAQLNTEQAS